MIVTTSRVAVSLAGGVLVTLATSIPVAHSAVARTSHPTSARAGIPHSEVAAQRGHSSSGRCKNSHISVRPGTSGAAGGNYKAVIILKNDGQYACSLRGHARIHFVGKGGTSLETSEKVGSSYTFEKGAKHSVQLNTGKSASFAMAPPKSDSKGCASAATKLKVAAPHAHHSQTIKMSFPYCQHGGVTVSNVVSGRHGPVPPGT